MKAIRFARLLVFAAIPSCSEESAPIAEDATLDTASAETAAETPVDSMTSDSGSDATIEDADTGTAIDATSGEAGCSDGGDSDAACCEELVYDGAAPVTCSSDSSDAAIGDVGPDATGNCGAGATVITSYLQCPPGTVCLGGQKCVPRESLPPCSLECCGSIYCSMTPAGSSVSSHCVGSTCVYGTPGPLPPPDLPSC